MARYECVRCHVVYHDSDGEHLCADLKKRYERQAKAIAIVENMLIDAFGTANGDLAVSIVQALSGRDLGFG